jgi:dCMP deaminase
MTLKWDTRFLELARHISEWSKDPSTKVGSVAVKDRRILATGYNGFPQGVADLPGRLENRNEKYLRTVHAEANAVAQAAKNAISLSGADIYVWPFIPCSSCCTLLIQAGVRRVIVPNTTIPDRWLESFDMSKSMFSEAKIDLITLDVL